MQLFVRAMRALIGSVLFGYLLYAPMAGAQENDAFIVQDIRIEGAQRISDGTLLNYLPVNVGDELTPTRIQAAIRALYASGFFKEIALRRDGNTLIVSVLERPSIASFSLEGNKDIDSDILLDSLRDMGLAEGRLFDRSALDLVKQELLRQYHSHGKYGMQVDAEVTDLGKNQVDIKINIKEGNRARIREINIVGNRVFSDEELLDAFELESSGWATIFNDHDAYESEKLQGDMESLKSYYMDRGYADFSVTSTAVTISPDLLDMYLTISLHEGEIYTVKEVKFSGNMVVPEAVLRPFVLVRPETTYSLFAATKSAEYITSILGAKGYGFAEVTPVPELDTATHEATVTFVVKPGKRTYVRQIHFDGGVSTQDEVYRREMRQFEAAGMSNVLLERSNTRIKRLPYVEESTYETVPVPGTDDMVDVNFDIKERQAGNLLFSVGYGSEIGAIINTGVTHANFLGTGDRISINLAKTTYGQSYSFSHTDPYAMLDEVSRTESIYFSSSEAFIRNSSSLDTDQYGGSLIFGYPTSEYTGVNWGMNVRHSVLATNIFSSQELIDFVSNNGDTYNTLFGPATELNTYELQAGFYYDTRNRTIFADRGAMAQVTAELAVPSSDVEYYTIKYTQIKYLPLFANLTLGFNGQISWGEPLGDTSLLPPYKHYYAGGPDTVRSYRPNYLGPRDSRGYPFGGGLRTFLQTELFIPPVGGGAGPGAARFGLFFDIGNVYATPSDFDADLLRASAGAAVTWLTPLGAMRFSWGVPLREQPGDLTESFQFSVGTVF